VVFTDGTAEPVDAVILATGYRTQLEDILPKDYLLLDEHGRPLSSGTSTAAPNLYFCGLHNSSTGLLYTISRESRQIAQHIARALTK
jgi:putative flavoprotein involved in K+ transport